MITDRWNERRLDVAALARDLAPLLGAQQVKDDNGDWRALLDLDGLRLWLSPEHGARKGRVEIGCSDPRMHRLHYGASSFRWPTITADASRPLDKIAAEIKRRVIEPGRLALDGVSEKLAAQDADDAQLAAHVAALRARFPFLRIDVKQDVASIYGGKAGASFTGRMRSDGVISAERVSADGPRVRAMLDLFFAD